MIGDEINGGGDIVTGYDADIFFRDADTNKLHNVRMMQSPKQNSNT